MKRILTLIFLAVALASQAQNTQVSGNATLTNSLVAAKAYVKLYAVTGYNSGSAQFIQVFQTNAVPSNGAVPIFSVPVGAQQYFSLDFSHYGVNLDSVTVCNSSTADTLTIGSANCGIQAITQR